MAQSGRCSYSIGVGALTLVLSLQQAIGTLTEFDRNKYEKSGTFGKD
jgi:hypothetical protein